jgi:O-antigen/teichoic acid export membrane protein
MDNNNSSRSPIGLTKGSVLFRSTLWNLVGLVSPLLVAFFSIPLLIKGLGTDRFGVLSIAWIVISYFSLFDLGLGRAMTKLVADKLGSGEEEEIPPLVWTSLILMLILGVVGALVVSLISPWLVEDMLKIPEAIRAETLAAFYLSAASLPVVISTTGLRGLLEAKQRFDLANALRIPMGVFTFVGPLMVLPFSQSLLWTMVVLLVGRVAAWLAHFWLCLQVMPALLKGVQVNPELLGPLMKFGGWMTVTNIVGPLMAYSDRFLIGALVSMSSVAYYVTPYEAVSKLWIIPGAMGSVLFPAFATSFVHDRHRTGLLLWRGFKYLFFALFPITLVLIIFSYDGLNIWVGAEFAAKSSLVMQLLAVGMFFNSLASIPFSFIQGAGYPDLTAKIHLIEFPFYLVAVFLMIKDYGIEGAAIISTVRVGLDLLLMVAITYRLLPSIGSTFKAMSLCILLSLLGMAVASQMGTLSLKLIFLVLALGTFTVSVWLCLLDTPEKNLIRERLKKISLIKI